MMMEKKDRDERETVVEKLRDIEMEELKYEIAHLRANDEFMIEMFKTTLKALESLIAIARMDAYPEGPSDAE
ncbi:unnamed protein product, partial [marine sediment metagenome]